MDKMKTVRGMPVDVAPAGPMLPSFSLTEKDLSAIKNWNVGSKYKLEVEVELVSLNKDEWLRGSPLSARFRIHKIKDVSLSESEKMARKGY